MRSPDPAESSVSADLFIDPPQATADGRIEFACRLVESPQSSRRIWFRFPREIASSLTPRADPYVLATLVYAMGRIRRVQVHGAVSEGLLANLVDFQTAFATFHGRTLRAPVEFFADRLVEPMAAARSVAGITAFSGGVDSCFSVYRNSPLSPLAPKRPLGAALMMHGFDIPLAETAAFARSAARSQRITDEAGIALFTGATNLRTLPVPWVETFATAIAASLSFFQPLHAFGLIPSCQDWAHARFDNGSNPLTDPLLSSLSFQIVHDGTASGRIEKLRELVKWPTAMERLRVCWQGEKLDRNCCRCEKCMRTMLMLRLCGVTQSPAFPRPLDLKQLDRLVIRSQGGVDEFEYLLEEARRRGLREPWMAPATRVVKRSLRHQRLWRHGQAWAKLIPVRIRELVHATGHRWFRDDSVSPAPKNLPPPRSIVDRDHPDSSAPKFSCQRH